MRAIVTELLSRLHPGSTTSGAARRLLVCGAMANLALAAILTAPLRAESPKFSSLFPAGIAPGEASSLSAVGFAGSWPAQVWVDRPGLELAAGKEKGQFEARVTGDAQPGVYWVRLHTADGASSPRPVWVETLPLAIEEEPNDDPLQPQGVQQPRVVHGRLAKGGDVDAYAVELQQGQTLVAAMQAHQKLGSPMDAVLQICSRDGFVLEQNDDTRGLDPQLVFTAPEAGTYLVRTFAFPATPNSTIGFSGGATYQYRLTLTTGPYIDHALPLALKDAPAKVRLFGWNLPDEAMLEIAQLNQHARDALVAHSQMAGQALVTRHEYPGVVIDTPDAQQATPVSLPATVSGRLEQPGDSDRVRVDLTKGQKLDVRVAADQLGFLLDPVIRIYDSAGKQLSEVDDASRQRDPQTVFTAPADGAFDIVVGDLHDRGGVRYAYRMELAEAKADFSLSVAADAFVLSPGKPLEIPVTVNRIQGFADEIQLNVEGLPDGIRVEPASSQAKGDTAKSVKLKLSTDKPVEAGVFTITGSAAGQQRTATYDLADHQATRSDLWLTVTK